jgi:hypothetical protein
MRNGIFIIGIVFTATLAYVVGNRLSNEALAVVVGALCGISASVPISIALFIAASRNWGRGDGSVPEELREPAAARGYSASQSPMIIFAPPQQFQSPNPFASNQFYLPSNAPIEGAPREFKIIGDD